MTVIRISESAPTFQINTSDISGGTFTGALSYLGASVYNLDTGLWYKIDATGQLIALTTGSVSTNGLTDTQLRASPVPITDLSLVTQGTTAPTKVAVVAGKTNDGTPQYREIPEGAGGRSVIVEGLSGGVSQNISSNAATMPATTTMQNAAVANGDGTSLPVTGYASAIIAIVSSVAMSGGTTINFEATTDDITWVPILAHQIGAVGTQASTTTIDGDFRINVAGFKSIRARISAYSAGTITIKGYVTPLAGQTTTVGLASTNNIIGATGGNTAEIDVVPTLTVHATYVSGDYVGTSSSPMTFTGASRINNYTGTILSAVLIDYALQSVACELWLFDTAITPPADSAAWSISDADCARCIGVIPFSTYYASALNSVSFAQGVGIGFKTLSASTSIYGCLVTRGAPTYASGDLTVRLTIIQD